MFKSIKEFVCKLFGKKSLDAAQPNLIVDAVAPPPEREQTITYLLNDPAYPELNQTIPIPKPNGLEIFVKYFGNKGAALNTMEGRAANLYGILCFGINYFNSKLNLNKWALVKRLNVDPAAGIQANAYYDRSNLKFFYFKNRAGKDVYTALSSDIASHELGHALLDAIRPEFFSTASAEIWAFHESFGDVVSILVSLKHPAVVKVLMQETGGDLRKTNIISSVAEEFGGALGMIGGLRNANNSFNYVKPENLPKNAPNDQLSSECHSFSRVMTGTFYDLLVELTAIYGGGEAGLGKATDILFDTYLDACRTAPNASNFFNTFCTTWLTLAEKKDKNIVETMKNVFKNRKIIGQASMQIHKSDQSRYKINMEPVLSFGVNDIKVYKFNGTCAVADLFANDIVAQSDTMNEIMSLNIQLPVDEMFVAMATGEDENISATPDEAADAAKYFIESLVENNQYGKDGNQPWYKDDDNNLVRKFFACDCFTPNYLIPGSPEYGKPYKPKNNSGCCTYGSCANLEKNPPKKVENTCNLRYSSSCSSLSYRGNC